MEFVKNIRDRLKSPGFLIILFGFILFLVDLKLSMTADVDYLYHYLYVIMLPIIGSIFLLSNTQILMKVIEFFRKDLLAVELVYNKKDITYSLTKYDKDGKLQTNLFYIIGLCKIELKEDGTIEQKFNSAKARWWLPLNKSKRSEHILKCDIPDIEALEE